MHALVGFSRFPIFYHRNRILSPLEARRLNREFYDYVNSLSGRLLAFETLPPYRIRKCIVFRSYATPLDFHMLYYVCRRIAVYPSSEIVEMPENIIALGFKLTGPRLPVFIPLTILTSIRDEDVRRLRMLIERFLRRGGREKPKAEFKARRRRIIFEREDVFRIVEHLGVRILRCVRLSDGKIAARIYDPTLNLEFIALLSADGRVIETNICFSGDVYLHELILNVRSRGDAYLYDEDSYDWSIYLT